MLLATAVLLAPADAEEGTVTVQVSADATLEENAQKIAEAYDANPGKDVIVVPSDDPSHHDRVRAELEADVQEGIAYVKALEEQKLASGEYYLGAPPPCARGDEVPAEFPVICDGKLMIPQDSEQAIAARAALSPDKVEVALDDDLSKVLLGFGEVEAELGLSSAFSGGGSINSVSFHDDHTLFVDFGAGLVDELQGLSGGQSARVQEQLMAAVFRYPQVQSVEFSVEGDCDAFWDLLEGDCQAAVRSDVPALASGELN